MVESEVVCISLATLEDKCMRDKIVVEKQSSLQSGVLVAHSYSVGKSAETYTLYRNEITEEQLQ